MRRAFLLSVLALALWACGGTPQPDVVMSTNKDYVLARLHAGEPVICDYKGRVAVRYEDTYQRTSFRAIVDKNCQGDATVKVLGPFGYSVADLYLIDGVLKIYQDGEDVTDRQSLVLGGAELELMGRFFRLPPPLPDETYVMEIVGDKYIFSARGTTFVVSSDFRVEAISEPGFTVGYGWNKEELKYMTFSYGWSKTMITFTDKWVVP